MAAPTLYTEETLAAFVHAGVLKAVATVLGWTVAAGSYTEIVNETVLAYFDGAGDLASATDIRRLRATARVEAWRAVMEETVADFDYEQKDDKFKRSDIHKQAKTAFEKAEKALATLPAASSAASTTRATSASVCNEVRF